MFTHFFDSAPCLRHGAPAAGSISARKHFLALMLPAVVIILQTLHRFIIAVHKYMQNIISENLGDAYLAIDKQKFKNEIADRLGGNIGVIISCLVTPLLAVGINEIRLRANKPVAMMCNKKCFFIDKNGQLSEDYEGAYTMSTEEISSVFARICRNSVYAFADDIKNGFVTIQGGHRVGICGKMQSDGTLRDISGLNIRISNEIKGCANAVFPYVVRGEFDIKSTLVISPPCCGKTTLVRDLARLISNGTDKPVKFFGINVGIVDERSEIASCIRGVAANDVGVRTDVLDACPKEKGIFMMLRSMAPRVIITDEIGGLGDYRAIASAINSGVRVVATAHGRSIDEVKSRREIGSMIDDSFFERYIVLSSNKGPGTVEKIF